MGLTAKANSGSETEPIEQGMHMGSCCWIIDLGMQEGFQGKKTHKVLIGWELPEQRIEINGEDKPRVCSKEFTLSLSNKANMYNMLVQWRGKAFTDAELEGFDLKNILGAPCQVQILHQRGKKDPTKTFANVESVLPAPKGTNLATEIDPIFFSFEDCEPGVTPAIPEALPEWVQDKIKGGFTWAEIGKEPVEQAGPAQMEEDDEEDPDVPF